MITTVKEELVSKILGSNDEILLKQLTLILDSNVKMLLSNNEKTALDIAYKAIETNAVISDDAIQKEWDQWIE
jgi:hypothetical protein